MYILPLERSSGIMSMVNNVSRSKILTAPNIIEGFVAGPHSIIQFIIFKSRNTPLILMNKDNWYT